MSPSKKAGVPRENIVQELEKYPLEVLKAALSVIQSREQNQSE